MSLHALPQDILHNLCAFLDTPTLRHLSHTHSAFYPYSQRYIYRHISIHSYPSALRCIQSLHKNRDHAPFVRSFALRLDPNANILRAFVDKLADVLADMTNLASLDLVLPPSASRVLAARTRLLVGSEPDSQWPVPAASPSPLYPRLARLSCNFSLDASVVQFLQRTPALKELQLGDPHGRASPNRGTALVSHPVSQSQSSTASSQQQQQQQRSALPTSAIPHLSLFMGSCQDATVIAPGRPLESVHLYSGDLSEDVLNALARSSNPITIFGSLTNSLSPSILHALASSLPHLQHLRIMTMYNSSNHPGDIFYAQVVQMLATLPELVTAELAGIRWAPWKKNSNGNGSRSARNASNTNTNANTNNAQQQQTTVLAH